MNTRTLLAIPYEVARFPLSVVDTRLAHRLAPDSLPRLVFDRALGSYDQFAGRLLADGDIEQLGTDRIVRSGKLARAVTLESEAAARREQAQQAGDSGRASAESKRDAAEQKAADGLDAAEATERQGKQQAASDARRQAADDKQAVQDRTEQRTSDIRSDEEQSEQAADHRLAAARKTASGQLDDASQTRQAAHDTRSEADQLGDLADAKKRRRRR